MPEHISLMEARARNLVIDDTCYPWVAYSGPRFNPDVWFTTNTLKEEMLAKMLVAIDGTKETVSCLESVATFLSCSSLAGPFRDGKSQSQPRPTAPVKNAVDQMRKDSQQQGISLKDVSLQSIPASSDLVQKSESKDFDIGPSIPDQPSADVGSTS